MKKQIISFSLVVAGFFLGATALSALAQTWSPPGTGYPAGTNCTPPNCNVPAPINVGSSAQAKTGLLGLSNFLFRPSGMTSVTPGSVLVASSTGDGTVAWGNISIPTNTTATPSYFYDLSGVTGNNTATLKYVSLLDPGTYTFSGKITTATDGGGGNEAVFFDTSDSLTTTTAYNKLITYCGGAPVTSGSGSTYKMYYYTDNSNLLFCLKRNSYNDGTWTIPQTVITFTTPTFMYVYAGQVLPTGYVHY